MSRAFDRATGWILRFRWLTCLLLLTLTAVASVGHFRPQWVRSWFDAQEASEVDESGSAFTESPPDVDPISLTTSDAILVIQSDQFFSNSGARALRAIAAELESLDYVDSVLWMDQMPMLNIFGLPEPLIPRAEASATRFAAARKNAQQHPLVGGQLLSKDGTTLLMLIRFDWLFVTSDADCTTGLKKTAIAAAAGQPDVDFSFLVTGRVPMYVTAMESHEANQLRYQLIGYSMIAIMALILFRGFTAVFIVAIAPAMGVYWTLGILQFFDLANNPFNDVILPILLSLVGLTDGVHLMVHIRRERVAGKSTMDAAAAGIRDVGLACGLTSLTTAVGFGSLTFARHEIVQQFGQCCVLGVILTFVAVVCLIPLACSSRLGRRVHIGHDKSLVDRHLMRIGGIVDWVLIRRRSVSIVAIGATLLLAGISLQLRPDERNASALPSGSEAAEGLRQMDKALGGLEFGIVTISWTDVIPKNSPKILEAVTAADGLMRSEPLIGHPISIRSLLDALPGDPDSTDRMPMLDLLPPPLKRAFITPEYRYATVSFRVQDLGIAAYGPTFGRIENELGELQLRHPEFRFELEGNAVWRWRNLYQIVVDLAASLGGALVVIFLILTLVYRSIRIGLISVVANLFPLGTTGAFLVMTGQSLEIVSVCAFTVCLGIAVDDSIHFLSRFQEESRKTSDQNQAIRRAFTGVGTALIMTTIVLVAGFSTVLFSDSRDHRIFASMGGLTITTALFGDLVFLPALIAWFFKPTHKKGPGPGSEKSSQIESNRG